MLSKFSLSLQFVLRARSVKVSYELELLFTILLILMEDSNQSLQVVKTPKIELKAKLIFKITC